MLTQFSRTELLFGASATTILQNSHVAVFGVGGVGGFVIEALVRSGIGTIDIVDSDKVALTNINRQIIATHDSVGRPKVEVMAERIHSINPDCKVNIHQCFFLPETQDQFDFSKYDYVVDAVDTVAAKIAIIMASNAAHTPVISCMGAGNKVNPAMFQVTDIYKTTNDPLARVIRQAMKARRVRKLKVVYSPELPLITDAEVTAICKQEAPDRRSIPGSNAFCPSVAGLILASEVVKDLLGWDDSIRKGAALTE